MLLADWANAADLSLFADVFDTSGFGAYFQGVKIREGYMIQTATI